MADVIHTPSLWDYIAQAGSAGIKSATDAKQYTDEQNYKDAGLAAQLFQQGAIDNTDLLKNPLIAKITPNIQPNKPQLARQIAASPDVNPTTGKQWSDEERQLAGFDPNYVKQVEQAKGSAAQLETAANAVRTRYMGGGHITDAEARMIGVPTGEEQLAQTDKTLQTVGPKYADAALAPLVQANGGRIPYRGWDQAVSNAAAAYNSDRAAHGLPPDPSAANFFSSQILDRLRQQKLMDIEQLKAQGMFASRPTPQDRMFDNLTGVVNSRITEMDALAKGDPMLMFNLKNPAMQSDPNVVRYKILARNVRNAQRAQAKLAGGVSADLMVGLEQDDPNNLTPTGSAPPKGGKLPPLTPADIQKAKEDPGFKNWLTSKGYKL